MKVRPLHDRIIVQRLEEGEQKVLSAILSSPIAVREIIDIGEKLKKHKIRVKEIIRDAEETEDGQQFDEEEADRRIIRLIDKVKSRNKKIEELREELREAWRGIRNAVGDRTMWIVAGFLFFWTFSPSIGIPLFYYQTDTLKFSQQFIGLLASLGAAAQILCAGVYAPLSRRYPLQRIIVWSIGIGVVGVRHDSVFM